MILKFTTTIVFFIFTLVSSSETPLTETTIKTTQSTNDSTVSSHQLPVEYSDTLVFYDQPLTFDSFAYHLETVLVSIVYILTFIFGSVGNSLVIAVILKYRRMRSVTNIFLLSLAVADLLLVLVCVPTKVRRRICYLYK